MIPVYVPSKGRAGQSATLTSMSRDGVSASVLVPDAEASSYRAAHPDHNVIGTTMEGIGPTRQEILRQARVDGHPYIWLIDDDITGMFWRWSGKFHSAPWPDALGWMAKEVGSWPTVAVAGPNHRQYAWSGPEHVANRGLRDVVLLKTDGPWDYWPFYLEDLDICLQALSAGSHTLRFNTVAYSAPGMGTLPGGCYDGYQAGALEDARRALHDRWEQLAPGLLSMLLHPKGYIQTKVKWNAFSTPIRVP